MSIFTKPINEIEFSDVVSFCEQGLKESVNLDYKKEFPSKLEKTLCAFANTYGGIVIIGVAEKDGSPLSPFTGIDYEKRLEDRVWSIIVDNIYPPISPEIQVCPPEDKKTFIVIRVPQSAETPHAIYNNTHVYIRTGNRNNPEELATIQNLQWLLNKRDKSEQFLEYLCNQAQKKYQKVCKANKIEIAHGELMLAFSPVYPDKPLIQYDEYRTLEQKIMNGLQRQYFPRINNNFGPIHDGIAHIFTNSTTGFVTYTEINKFGLLFYKENIARPTQNEGIVICLDTIVKILQDSFRFMGDFYHIIGYWGLIKIQISLQKLEGIKFVPLFPKDYLAWEDDIEISNLEEKLSWDVACSIAELNEDSVIQEKVVSLGKEIAWSFGYRQAPERILERLKGKQ